MWFLVGWLHGGGFGCASAILVGQWFGPISRDLSSLWSSSLGSWSHLFHRLSHAVGLEQVLGGAGDEMGWTSGNFSLWLGWVLAELIFELSFGRFSFRVGEVLVIWYKLWECALEVKDMIFQCSFGTFVLWVVWLYHVVFIHVVCSDMSWAAFLGTYCTETFKRKARSTPRSSLDWSFMLSCSGTVFCNLSACMTPLHRPWPSCTSCTASGLMHFPSSKPSQKSPGKQLWRKGIRQKPIGSPESKNGWRWTMLCWARWRQIGWLKETISVWRKSEQKVCKREEAWELTRKNLVGMPQRCRRGAFSTVPEAMMTTMNMWSFRSLPCNRWRSWVSRTIPFPAWCIGSFGTSLIPWRTLTSLHLSSQECIRNYPTECHVLRNVVADTVFIESRRWVSAPSLHLL